ncbi:MAG: hypothetical protein AAF366_09850 [Pseudomonadota bacterium]
MVFAHAGPQAWQVGRSSNGRRKIEFEANLPMLDLSRIFQRIPTTRLLAVEQDANALDLTLNCDCPVEVNQLRSGHVVVDIQDPILGSDQLRQALTLPIALPAEPILLRPLPMPTTPAIGPRIEQTVTLPTGLDPRRHVAIRDGASGSRPVRQSPVTRMTACGFERVARDHLLADPELALTSLPSRRLAVTGETGDVVEQGLHDMADLYLDLGWGQEALLVMRHTGDRDPDRRLLARIVDDVTVPPGTLPDAACGPASALAAILSGLDARAIRQVDVRSLANFVTDLPKGHAANLRPRLIAALEAAGAQDALAFLDALDQADVPAGDIAGTNAKTAGAIIESVLGHSGYPDNLPEALLVNALAFRQSMPADATRADLDRALVSGLAASGYVVEAVQVARVSAVTIEYVLEQVLDHLPPGQAAAAAMRLRRDVDMDHPVAARAAELFADYGMDTTARLFSAAPAEAGSTIQEGPAADPWLIQNFDAVAGAADEDDQDPRAALARLLADDDGQADPAGAPLGDVAQAEAELERAAMLREMLSDLLTAPSS